MEVQGTLLEVKPVNVISERFKKREFVLQTVDSHDSRYAELICFEAHNARCDMLDDLIPGQPYNVTFNLKGRKWENQSGEVKYFNTLQAWKVEPLQGQLSGAQQAHVQPAQTVNANMPF